MKLERCKFWKYFYGNHKRCHSTLRCKFCVVFVENWQGKGWERNVSSKLGYP
jgi:hypothetical protein